MEVDDKYLIGLYLQELAEKMGYRDPSRLSERDYKHLCSQVEKETGISLSLSTVKRIFNGHYKRLPQTYTLNALTQYIGYEDWQDFKAKHYQENPKGGETPQAIELPPERKRSGGKLMEITAAVLGVALLCIIAFYILGNYTANWKGESARKKIKVAGVKFSARKSQEEGVPNSVIFNYNVDQVEADSFMIQTSWNPESKKSIKKNNYTQTALYYEPGLHTARLLADGVVLKEIVLDIPTNSWIAFSRTNWNDPPVYYKGQLVHDEVYGLTSTELEKSKLTPDRERFYVYAWFPSEMKLDSDNFQLKTRMRLRSEEHVPCPGIHTTIYCEKDWMYFTKTIPGCISELSAQFSDKYVSGKVTDLSSFGYDLTTWHSVEFRVRQKKVQVLIEGEEVLEEEFTHSAGGVKGLSFRSNGICEIDFVELRDGSGTVVYKENFVRQE